MTLASQGVAARFCTEPGSAPHTFDASSEPFEFLSENVAKHASLFNPNGIRGTRSPCYSRTRKGPYSVAGQVRMNVSPADLAIWLPRIMGANASGNTFALAETLPAFGCLFNRVAQTFQYTDCYVDKAVFRGHASTSGASPPLIEMTLDILGTTEALGTSFPAVTLDCTSIAYQPFIFSDGVVTLAATSRPIMNFLLLIDNHLDARFTNSITATSITPLNRTVALRTTNPFTADELDLYDQAAAGAAGSLVFTNGAVSTTFTFAKLQVPARSPVVMGKQEVPLYLDMISREAGTKELVVTNDSTV